MSGNSYRNNRNSYRRKRRNEQRGLVAIVVVTIMAAGIIGAYGVINLFTGDGSSKSGTVGTGSAVEVTDNTNNGTVSQSNVSQTPSGNIASAGVRSGSNVSSETGDNTGVTAKNNDKHENKNTGRHEKTDIKELVTATKEAEEAYYKGAVFIGDSRTQGLQINAGLKSPDFFAGRGLNVKNARTEKVVTNAKGQAVTVIDALKDRSHKENPD